MLEFRSGTDTIVTGVTFQNAPYWALHPYNCTRFSVEGVRSLVSALHGGGLVRGFLAVTPVGRTPIIVALGLMTC